ncbi:cell division protein DivIC [Salirhabdus euzebyi]|uniref:Cell division protein DivIC n=1 Tax=Salirhabdus euzebyi TaxID=394506 RepID=A0A841QA57_9BACI|nr:septum formation initiator family protein [Salirhabdus euzebyi]MBB6455255.1 cell division protein DivIC [Salirhabdus euzebyi]
MNPDRNRVTKLDSNYVRKYDAFLERQKKRKKRVYRRLTLFVIIVLSVFGYLVTYHIKQRALYEEKKDHYEQLKVDMSNLKEEEQDLREEISLLKDTDYVLQIARKDYFLSKEGEIIFKLPDDRSSY